MKKNIRLNKQIIKALSIGISAGMLLQPVSAFAAEPEGAEPTPTIDGDDTITVAPIVPAVQASTDAEYDAAEALATEADGEVGKAVDAYQEAVDTMTAVSDNVPTEVWTAVTDLQTAIDANKDALDTDCENAGQVVEEMQQKAEDVSLWEVSANNLKAAAEDDVSAGDAAVAKAEKLAEDTNDAMDVLVDDVSANIAAINNTTDYNTALGYYNICVSDGNAADAIIAQAEKDYGDIKKEYDDAKADYDAKDAAYTAAVTAYNTARAEYEQLRDSAISGNDSYVIDALNRLAALKKEADELKDVAEDASQKLMETSSGYLEIAQNEQDVLEAEKSDNEITIEEWNKTLDDLFAAMMKYYVVPDMFNGKADNNFKAVWYKDNNNQKLNYCLVTYNNGQTIVTETFNYILSQKDNKGIGFVIFRKNKNEDNNISLNATNTDANFVLAEYDYQDGIADYYTYYGYEARDLTPQQAAQTEDFRSKIDAAYSVNLAYTDLFNKLTAAQTQYVAAEKKVEDLEKAISDLKLSADADFQVLNKLQGDLTKAERRLDEAKKKRDDIKDQINNIVLPNPPGPIEPNPGPIVPDQPNPGPVEPVTPVTPILAAPAPVLEIPAEEVPLAEEPDAEVPEEPTPVLEVEDDDVALAAAPVTVTDDATPLAALPEEAQMSWWWLLIVLVLGATGAEMYRRHMAKKKAAEINTTDMK